MKKDYEISVKDYIKEIIESRGLQKLYVDKFIKEILVKKNKITKAEAKKLQDIFYIHANLFYNIDKRYYEFKKRQEGCLYDFR